MKSDLIYENEGLKIKNQQLLDDLLEANNKVTRLEQENQRLRHSNIGSRHPYDR